ncbi:MAG: MBL fold metallo-hydrolase [Ruminococcus sp.]|nr:MBL fold metallo-hydrolase [Ruminococcus sp.]
MHKRLLALLTCTILIFSLFACESAPKSTNNPIEMLENAPEHALAVHYIDVGQGDSILLESQGEYILIDAGEKEYGPTVCAYLEDLGVTQLDYVIATHPHSDHCGGLTDVINSFECENFITVETDQQTKTWVDVLLAVDETNCNYIDAVVGNTYSFGESYFEILGPVGTDYDNYNDYSVIVKAVCGDNSFLFTGDMETYAEKELLAENTDLKSDVLKVGHHGSTTSSSNAFLDAVSPDYAVIMCGKGNEYGHPHLETLDNLNARGITVYRTDELSSIVAFSDKNNISFAYVNTDKVVEQATKPQVETDVQSENSDDSDQNVYESFDTYVGNKNSKKLHYPNCVSVEKMSDKNKVYFDTADEALGDGYTWCQSCHG